MAKKRRKQHKAITEFWTSTASGKCHTGSVDAFHDPETGIVFRGGGSLRNLLIQDELIITAASDPRPVRVEGIEAGAVERWTNPAIKLDWNDGSGFTLPKLFWTDLVALIRSQHRPVLAMCAGGHGRTGTMLAILAALTGATRDDPVQFIRDNYCDHAVETEAQIAYIEEITGLKVAARPSRMEQMTGFGFYSLSDWRNWWDRQDGPPPQDEPQSRLKGWGEVE